MDWLIRYLFRGPRLLQHAVTILQRIDERTRTMANELAALQAQVAANNSVIESAITLIQGIKAALDAAKNDPAALQALSDSLSAEDSKLAAAVVANTPVEKPADAPPAPPSA